MKRYLVCFLVCIIWVAEANAQQRSTFQEAYDRISNENCLFLRATVNDLTWDSSRLLQSYLEMYKATGEIHYLTEFIYRAKAILATRSDNPLRLHENSKKTNFWGTRFDPQITHRGWKSGFTDCPALAYDGEILSPMAEYVRLVHADPALAKMSIPRLELNDCGDPVRKMRIDALNKTKLMRLYRSSFGEVADFLQARIEETIQDLDVRYYDPGAIMGYKIYTNQSGAACEQVDIGWPYNHLNSYAKLMLFLIDEVDAATREIYMNRVHAIAAGFKAGLTLDSSGKYTWHYRPNYKKSPMPFEDISHGAIDLKFAWEYMNFQSPHFAPRSFTPQDFEYFKNTFIQTVDFEPGNFHFSVGGGFTGHSVRSVKTNEDIWASQGPLAGWLMLSEYDPSVFHRIADLFNSYALYEELTGVKSGQRGGNYLLALSYCVKYQQYFNPVAKNDAGLTPDGNWVGVAGGDVNADGVEDIISIRSEDNTVIIWEVGMDSVTGSHTVMRSNEEGSGTCELELSEFGSGWTGLACGNFDGIAGDEIATITNSNGNIHTFSFLNGRLRPLTTYTKAHSSSDWTGIAAGDVDNDGIDEIATIRNKDKRFILWEYNAFNHSLQQKSNGALYLDAANEYGAMAAGDFDQDGRAEFVVVSGGDTPGFQIVDYDVKTGKTAVSASYFEPDETGEWKALAAGNFSGTGHDEFLAIHEPEGAVYQYTLDPAADYHTITSTRMSNREHFSVADQNHFLGAINLYGPEECPDYLLMNRNFDGDMFIYSLYDSLASTCSNTAVTNRSKGSNEKWGPIPGCSTKLTFGPRDLKTDAELKQEQQKRVFYELLPSVVNAQLEFQDAWGRTVRSIPLEPGSRFTDVKLWEFSDGFYYYSVRQDGVPQQRSQMLVVLGTEAP